MSVATASSASLPQVSPTVPALRKRPRLRAQRLQAMSVAPQASAVSDARRAVNQTLTRWGVAEEPVFVAELCATELLTNAVQHAVPSPGGEISLQITQGRAGVLIEVEDGGSKEESAAVAARPSGSVDDGKSEHGRGLLLVEELSGGCWGRRRVGPGQFSMWAYVAVSGSRGAR
ncbi:ATP-binding protein [Streptomyces sp. URMC 127]|uniref:ATP-binding protein n=1 Tax=Streptomyces sp. URMC 127 TaxID=3423402 RepID=UPI003F19A6AC